MAAEIEIKEINRGEAAKRIDKDLPKEGKREYEKMLYKLLEECSGRSNPLHLAAQHGHFNFVRDFLRQKPELAFELNSQGQSPLHLASARGHVGVVEEILQAAPDACFVRDRDGMIPLHIAAINGRLDVLGTLVNANIKTAYILTDRGEPILHLCAKYHQFKALEKLVELVKNEDFVNLKDNDDNTILHALSKDGNLKVIKLLLENPEVDINAENKDRCTPLDILLLQIENIWDGYRIWRLLTEKGAKRDENNSPFVGLFKKLKNPVTDESQSGESLMVVAILMATVAFQAGLSPPGGFWQDTTSDNGTLPNVTQSSPPPNLVPHYAGKSIMSYVDPSRYNHFSRSNDITLALSLLVIQLLLARYLFKSRSLQSIAVILTSISLLGMSFTFYNSAAFISLHKQPILIVVPIFSFMLYVCLIFRVASFFKFIWRALIM